MKIHMQEEYGHHMVQVGGIVGLLWITSYSTMYIWNKQELNELVI